MDVRLPDGTIVKNVPEGTTREQIAQKLGRPDLMPLKGLELAKARTLAAGQGAMLGFGDEVLSGVSAATDVLKGKAGISDIGDRYNKWLDYTRNLERRYAAERPIENVGVQIGAGIPTVLGTGGSGVVARGATTATRIGRGAAAGAGYGTVAGYGSGEGGTVNRLGSAGTGAVLGAATGAGFEALAAPVRSLFRRVVSNRQWFDANTGTLTNEGRQALSEAGVPDEQITDDFMRAFAQFDNAAGEGRAPMTPQAAARRAAGEAQPIPVPQTRGQVTLDPNEQMFESQARKGVYGEGARQVFQGTDEAQQAALRQNVTALQGRLSGGVPQVAERGQGGAMVQERLAQAERTADRAVGQNFDAARTAGNQAGVTTPEMQRGLRQVGDAITSDYTRNTAPKAFSLLDDFERVHRQWTDGSAPIGTLFDWRRTASNLRGGADRVEGGAAGKLVRAFDDFLRRQVDDALIQGDPQAVQAWRRAIASRREYGKLYEGGDLIERLTERAPYGGSGRPVLKVDPHDAARVIFGAGDLGFVTKRNLVRDVVRLRGVLGRDSREWNALREEMFMNIASKAEGAMEGGTRRFSGANLQKAWSSAWQKNPGLMRTFFSDEERRAINSFVNLAARVTTPVAGGANTSNTSAALVQALRRLGPLARVVETVAEPFIQATRQARAVRSVSQAAPRQLTYVPAYGAAGAGATGNVAGQRGQ